MWLELLKSWNERFTFESISKFDCKPEPVFSFEPKCWFEFRCRLHLMYWVVSDLGAEFSMECWLVRLLVDKWSIFFLRLRKVALLFQAWGLSSQGGVPSLFTLSQLLTPMAQANLFVWIKPIMLKVSQLLAQTLCFLWSLWSSFIIDHSTHHRARNLILGTTLMHILAVLWSVRHNNLLGIDQGVLHKQRLSASILVFFLYLHIHLVLASSFICLCLSVHLCFWAADSWNLMA